MCEIQFENEDFWIACIKQSAVKRMIDLGFNDADLISNAVKLETDEIEKLINLKKSFIFYLDKKFRFNFVNYYSSNKYVGFAIKRFIGLNDGDVFEFDFSKSLEFPEYEEYDLEFKAISDGKDLAHNLALLKLFNLKYSRQDISTILGSDDVKKFDKDGIVDTGYLDDMIKIHSKNKGIRYKQREILFNLLDLKTILKMLQKLLDGVWMKLKSLLMIIQCLNLKINPGYLIKINCMGNLINGKSRHWLNHSLLGRFMITVWRSIVR